LAATISKAGTPGPITDRVSLGGTAGNATKLTFPRWAREIAVRIFASNNETQSAGFVSSTGTDGAAMDSNGIRVELGVPFMLSPSPGGPAVELYVSADSANDVAHVSVSA
jgi:hypothetical protein